MAIQGGPIYDDPYILWRYGENLATGHGWVFNAGTVADNAVTSPLMVAVLAGGRFLGLHMTLVAAVVFFLTTWAAAFFTSLALESLGHRMAGFLTAALVAVSPALTALWGMESSLFLALLAGALAAAAARRPAWVTGFFIGLLALARPDGLVVGGVLVAVFYVADSTRRLSLRSWCRLAAAAVAPVVAWIVIAWWSFGTVVPSTLAAKRAQGASRFWPTYLSSEAWLSVRTLLGGGSRVGGLVVVLLIVAACLGLVAGVLRAAAWQAVVTLTLSTVVISVGYGLIFRIASYPWYYALAIYCGLVLAGLGIEFPFTSVTLSRPVRWACVAALGITIVVCNLSDVQSQPSGARQRYEVVGTWLERNAPRNATVAASEVGKLGWYSGHEMVDYLGLLDRRADRHIRHDDFEWWASYYQPDYWVTDLGYIDAKFAASRCVEDHFEVVYRAPPLVVFRRASAVPASSHC